MAAHINTLMTMKLQAVFLASAFLCLAIDHASAAECTNSTASYVKGKCVAYDGLCKGVVGKVYGL